MLDHVVTRWEDRVELQQFLKSLDKENQLCADELARELDIDHGTAHELMYLMERSRYTAQMGAEFIRLRKAGLLTGDIGDFGHVGYPGNISTPGYGG
jgi:hypothetical protein